MLTALPVWLVKSGLHLAQTGIAVVCRTAIDFADECWIPEGFRY